MAKEQNNGNTPLAIPYPDEQEWKQILKTFSPAAIAHKLLLAQVPYVFRKEPVKFALFRRTIADAFKVHPTDVFIVGSAMAGRSLKGESISKEYSPESDIDTLIISESLFTTLLMDSLKWVQEATTFKKSDDEEVAAAPTLERSTISSLNNLAKNACKGIWRPDSLPALATVRRDFFANFDRVSLHTLGLQLSEDTVAHVSGRVARSFDCAVQDLENNIRRLANELDIERSGKKKKIVKARGASAPGHTSAKVAQ